MFRRTLTAVGLLLLAGLQFPGPALAQAPLRFVPGQHYQELDKPLPRAQAGTVDVIEFFLYACSHCYAQDKQISEWADNLPEGTHFRRVPVLFGSNGENLARLFYSLQELGQLERLHSDIFDAIHEQGHKLDSPAAISRFLVDAGLEEAQVKHTFGSKAVNTGVAESAVAMRAFRVTAVPSIGVAGKYWITARMAGGNEAMLEVAEHLIRREKATQ